MRDNAGLPDWISAPDAEMQSFRAHTESPVPGPQRQTGIRQPVIQPQESTFAALLYHLIPAPRAARRFSAVYRELKEQVPSSAMAAFEGSDGGPGHYQVPMLLLAVRIAAGAAAEPLFRELCDHAERSDDVRHLLLRCATAAPGSAALAMIQGIIRPIVSDPSFPTAAALFRVWVPRVGRYSFDTSRAARCSWTPRAERSLPEPNTGRRPAQQTASGSAPFPGEHLV